MKIPRRDFLKLSMASGVALFLESRTRFLQKAFASTLPQMPLEGSEIPQFIDPVPNLLDADHLIVAGEETIELEMREHMANILPAGVVPGYAGTYVWSYLKVNQSTRASYLGPVIVATRGIPTEMRFANLLGDSMGTNVLAYMNSTDQTLHWADPLHNGENMAAHMAGIPAFGSEAARNYDGPVPACVHLHGGEIPSVLDGGPEAWFTSDGSRIGSTFYSRDWDGVSPQNYCIYRYPNCGEGALIWFHDHTLGATRLNVYCGLAGGYLIHDPNDTLNLPPMFPLVLQDRMFDTNGQLFFPADSSGGEVWSPNPQHPIWVPEFVGDVIVINGKSWPYLDVEPKRTTFLFINGSNARTYGMSLVDPVSKNPGPPLWVVGTDGGYLDLPVKIDPTAATNASLVMMPGERYWVIVDFAKYNAGMIGPNGAAYSGTWLLKNNAKTPYPAGDTSEGNTLGRMMQFRVTGSPVIDTTYDPASGLPLRPPMIRLSGAAVQKTRQLTLNEIMGMPVTTTDPVTGELTSYEGGPLEILVNNTKWDGERITGVTPGDMPMYTREPIPGFILDKSGKNWLSEVPVEGETEIWEIVNLTADAHPIHLHLVQFQLLSRQNFNTNKYTKAYAAAFPAGFDYTMGMNMGPKVFIPAYGPPLNYFTGNSRALGGNPDIAPFLQGPVHPPLPQENGWKDTIISFPGQVTRIIVRWAPTDIPAATPPADASFTFDPSDGDGYVWHCHIVDHEDNEMMRPDAIIANKAESDRTYRRNIDY